MKSYTDIGESKKLAEILPLETADMCYIKGKAQLGFLYEEYKELGDSILQEYEPCWSLAALYSILPNNENISTTLYRDGLDKWICEYDGRFKIIPSMPNVWDTSADNPIDACVDMIVKIHELKNML